MIFCKLRHQINTKKSHGKICNKTLTHTKQSLFSLSLSLLFSRLSAIFLLHNSQFTPKMFGDFVVLSKVMRAQHKLTSSSIDSICCARARSTLLNIDLTIYTFNKEMRSKKSEEKKTTNTHTHTYSAQPPEMKSRKKIKIK